MEGYLTVVTVGFYPRERPQPGHSHLVPNAVFGKVGVRFESEEDPMSRKCDNCGKGPIVGNQYTKRGKPKYLGGNGVKVTGKHLRRFLPNLQRMQVQVGGSVETLRVCTSCIRSGLVKRPVKRKPFQPA
jgi:large subunit ribosomal protein L28